MPVELYLCFQEKTQGLSCLLSEECKLRRQAPTQAESFTVRKTSHSANRAAPFSSHLRVRAPDATGLMCLSFLVGFLDPLETAQQEKVSRHLDAIRTWPSASNGGLSCPPVLLSDAVGCESLLKFSWHIWNIGGAVRTLVPSCGPVDIL